MIAALLRWLALAWLGLFVWTHPGLASPAEPARVAVAMNFLPVARELAPLFRQQTGHRLTLIGGASGKLYAQIRQGAPYDVLLSADRDKPARLEALGLTVPGKRFVYASGRLALWAGDGQPLRGPQRLYAEPTIALANPRLAPYGQAAMQVLRYLALDLDATQRVLGENVAQATRYVATGHAPIGLVAWSLIPPSQRNQAWLVPAYWHAPIDQEAVLLLRGAGQPAAVAFIRWLRGQPAQARIEAAGYAVVDRAAIS